MDLLVVAAWEPELERFRELLASHAGTSRCVVAGAVGVGVVEAAVGTTRRLAAHSRTPAGVLFVGTCGALPGSDLATGDVVVVARTSLVSTSALRGEGALPGPMPASADADASLVARATSRGARAVTAATTTAITTDDALARSLAARGEVEHLEVFAVARACEAAGVPWSAVLGVANPVGAAGRDAWRAHHADASARAADVAFAAFGT